MSDHMLARLQVHDISALVRGSDPDRPVLAGTDGTRVVLLLDEAHARDLQQIIGVGTAAAAGDLTTDTATWDQAITDLVDAALDLDQVGLYALPNRGTAR